MYQSLFAMASQTGISTKMTHILKVQISKDKKNRKTFLKNQNRNVIEKLANVRMFPINMEEMSENHIQR